MTGPDDAFLAPDDALRDGGEGVRPGSAEDVERSTVAPGQDDADHDGPTGSADGGVEPA